MRKFITTRGRTGHVRPAVLAALGAALLFGCTADVGTAPDTHLTVANVNPLGTGGYDLNDPSLSPANVNGAWWIFGVDFGVGTGVIDPFLSIQNAGTEVGFNTDASPLPLDDTRPQFTDALPLNNIPVIKYDPPGGPPGQLFREVILEANEANSGVDAFFSIDFFNLYICDDVGVATAATVAEFESNPNCVLIYDFAGKVGFATDGLTSGSGQGLDYDILIPEANFDAFQIGQVTVDDCPYNPLAPDCGLYVILHTSMGGFGGDWVTGSTFEEYSTVLQPFVEVAKTAVPTFDRNYLWDIQKSVDPTDIYLFDGQSQDANYTVTVTQTGTEDSGWNVSGSVTITNPSQSDAEVTSVIDLLQPGGIPVTLGGDCAGPFTLAAGASTVCNYSHDFESDPGATEFTNTVEIELAGLAITTGESETFSFSAPTTETNKTVNVTDLFDGVVTDLATGISTGDVFNYSKTFTCGDDEGSNPNTAKVIGDGGAELDEASANVNVNCLDLTVTKDAATALERTYLWDITKTVTPETWDLFDGDDGTSDYTVTATPNGSTDAGWSVSGNIDVTNPNSVAVYVTNIADAISGFGAVTVDQCTVNGGDIGGPSFAAPGYMLAAGATITCAYSQVLPDGANRTNTATATAKPTETGTAKDFTGQAAVDFAGVVLTEVNKTVNITDNLEGDLGTANHDDGPTPFNYSSTFACENDNDRTVNNTAKIVETNQEASASVTINCHQLAVTKTADTEWTRTWTWSIQKDIDATHFAAGTYDAGTNTATVMENTALEVKYDITLDATSANSMMKVAGTVTVSNAGNPIAATINSVTDVVSVGMNATVDCGVPLPTDIAAGGSLDCAYGPLELPDLTQRVNTGTATQQNFSYASDGTASNSGTTDYSGMADVIFADDPTFEIDECVDVTDVLKQGGVDIVGPEDLGTLCAGDNPLPSTFTVFRTFGGTGGIPLVCGDNVFDNMGMFTTNDTGTQGQDPATINIFVECIVGCTLTQGYWKTHNESFRGGASKKADLTWGLVGPLAEQETFFLSGDTWFGVFWTAPKGNAYYNLAHQYMAATLNQLAGATSTPEVDAALAFATDYFTNNDPSDSPRGRDARALRDAATVLDDYNNGLIGPGHCTEN